MVYEPVIGLEVHAQLLTNSKIFCGCSTEFGKPPNSQTCPVCLGLPGALPVLNKRAVELAIKAALALNCTVAKVSIFARKHYFYPDLPKGYQISQYEEPLAYNGELRFKISNYEKRVRIKRLHLEEDAGKLLHSEDSKMEDSLLDLNRAGVPLIEIVSEPDISSPKEAYFYLLELKQILQYLEVSSGDMEKGALRCDANVSLKREGKEGVRTEIKNLNSFKSVEKALSYEIERQRKILEKGGEVVQETLLWDERREVSHSMRGKEESMDYRYFPEPDLPPLCVSNDWIIEIKNEIPELPKEKRDRFMKEYGILGEDAILMTLTRALADYFEECAKECMDGKIVVNWIGTEILGVLNERKIEISDFWISPKDLAELLIFIKEGKISGKIGKEVFEIMVNERRKAGEIIQERGLIQISDEREIEKVVERVINENKLEVDKYLSGKAQVFGFFVGQVMKKMNGKANPKVINDVLKKKLEELRSAVN